MVRRVTCLTLVFSSIATASLQFPHGLTDDGFDSQVSFVPSADGNASCMIGLISLTTTSTYMNINFPNPESPEAITDAFLNLVGNNYTIYTSSSGTTEKTKSFNIWSKLCVPVDSTVQSLDTVHFLTHGGTVDHSYWDLAKGYSYVDAAANAGYATFSYDRLGIGHSSRPDPIDDVQAPVQVDLAHLLIQKLREGAIGGAGPFKHVVGVGHSAGSTFTEAISAKYPRDYDAVIVTGTSADPGSYAMSVMVSWDPVQASDAPKGYFTQATRQAVQFPFFKWPYFEPWILDLSYQSRQTTTLGELISMSAISSNKNNTFSGPVQVLTGINDYPFCGGDCSSPSNKVVSVLKNTFPQADANRSKALLIQEAGHNLNAHLSAQETFRTMLEWVKELGL